MTGRAAFIERFLLPLVEGGEVHVGAPLGFRGLASIAEEPADTDAERRLSTARWLVAREHLVHALPPSLDEDALRLGIALHDLLFLSHPDGPDAARGRGHRLVALGSAALAELESTGDARELVARHSILHRLLQLGRTDVRVSFWVGKREFHGQVPPARLMAWPRVRRVSEERWRVGCMAEAAGDAAGGADVVRALLRASPLTDLLGILRLEPPFDLSGLVEPVATVVRVLAPPTRGEGDDGDDEEGHGEDGFAAAVAEGRREVGEAGLRAALSDPEVCRMVAYRWLEEGIERTGSTFAAALVRRLGARRPDDLRFALALLAHLHLCLMVAGQAPRVELIRAAGRGDPNLRDFVGLFAALHQAAPALAAPADCRAGPALGQTMNEHAAECATVCGAARLRELVGLVGRTMDGSELV